MGRAAVGGAWRKRDVGRFLSLRPRRADRGVVGEAWRPHSLQADAACGRPSAARTHFATSAPSVGSLAQGGCGDLRLRWRGSLGASPLESCLCGQAPRFHWLSEFYRQELAEHRAPLALHWPSCGFSACAAAACPVPWPRVGRQLSALPPHPGALALSSLRVELPRQPGAGCPSWVAAFTRRGASVAIAMQLRSQRLPALLSSLPHGNISQLAATA